MRFGKITWNQGSWTPIVWFTSLLVVLAKAVCRGVLSRGASSIVYAFHSPSLLFLKDEELTCLSSSLILKEWKMVLKFWKALSEGDLGSTFFRKARWAEEKTCTVCVAESASALCQQPPLLTAGCHTHKVWSSWLTCGRSDGKSLLRGAMSRLAPSCALCVVLMWGGLRGSARHRRVSWRTAAH